ncbi:MAG: hypothetical protein ACREJK_09410, partial [Candidatus Methylomirabilales bacterium]
ADPAGRGHGGETDEDPGELGAMDDLGRAFVSFLHQVAVGGMAALLLIPFEAISRQFFRIAGLILLTVEGLALWRTGGEGWIQGWSGALFVALLLAFTVFWFVPGTPGAMVLHRLGIVAGVFLLVADVLGYPIAGAGPLGIVMGATNALTSALLLGTALVGLLLGHRYLNEPHLPVSLIKRLSDVFCMVILLQGALPALFTLLVYSFGQSNLVGEWLRLLGEHWALLFGRMIVGIGASLGVALVILNCLRLPNVPAATGFYYVAVITVFLGEFLGRYLRAFASLPF